MNYKQLCRINDDYNVNAPGYEDDSVSSSSRNTFDKESLIQVLKGGGVSDFATSDPLVIKLTDNEEPICTLNFKCLRDYPQALLDATYEYSVGKFNSKEEYVDDFSHTPDNYYVSMDYDNPNSTLFKLGRKDDRDCWFILDLQKLSPSFFVPDFNFLS